LAAAILGCLSNVGSLIPSWKSKELPYQNCKEF